MRLIGSIVLLTLLLTLASANSMNLTNANSMNLTQLLISTNGTIMVSVPPTEQTINNMNNSYSSSFTNYLFTAKNGRVNLLSSYQSTDTINYYNNSMTIIYNGNATKISSVTNLIIIDTNFTSGVVYTNKSSTIYFANILYSNGYATTWVNTTVDNNSIKANESSTINSLLSKLNAEYNISGIISSARNYLIQQYGQEYVDSHMQFNRYSYPQYTFFGAPNLSGVYFKYSMPTENGSTVKTNIFYYVYNATTKTIQPAVSNLFADVFISYKNNSVVGYLGPDRPYVPNITKQEAISIAERAGLQNVSMQNSILTYAIYQSQYASNYNDTIGIYKLPLVWAIQSNNLSYVQPLGSSNKTLAKRGLYINTQDGSVMGEFAFYDSNSPYYPDNYAPLGTYSLFPINSTNVHVVYQTPTYYYLLVAVAIILILSIVIYLEIKRK